jgi:hypothetical protein
LTSPREAETLTPANLFEREDVIMPDNEDPSGALPTEQVTKEQRVILVRSLLVDWKVFEHLHEQGVVEERFALRAQDGCCKPDGGTCCVNKG